MLKFKLQSRSHLNIPFLSITVKREKFFSWNLSQMQTSAVKKRDHSVVDKYTISSRAIPACPRFSLHQIEYPYPPCCMSHFLSICTIASVQSAFRISHQGIQPAVSYKQINLRNEKCRSPPRSIKTIQRTVQISKHPPSMRRLK